MGMAHQCTASMMRFQLMRWRLSLLCSTSWSAKLTPVVNQVEDLYLVSNTQLGSREQSDQFCLIDGGSHTLQVGGELPHEFFQQQGIHVLEV